MPLLSTLVELHLQPSYNISWGSPIPGSMLPLTQLASLRSLQLGFPDFMVTSSLEQLTRLQQLTLDGTMPDAGLPPSLTGLTLVSDTSVDPVALKHLNSVTTLRSFGGTLLRLDLGTWITQWANDPGSLVGPWSQHLVSLVLWWDWDWQLPPATFSFAQLQKLELVLGDPASMVPSWDFAGCPMLQEVTFDIHQHNHAEQGTEIDWRQVINLHTHRLVFDFRGMEHDADIRLAIIRSTWQVQHVHIHCRSDWEDRHISGDLHIVGDLVGALLGMPLQSLTISGRRVLLALS